MPRQLVPSGERAPHHPDEVTRQAGKPAAEPAAVADLGEIEAVELIEDGAELAVGGAELIARPGEVDHRAAGVGGEEAEHAASLEQIAVARLIGDPDRDRRRRPGAAHLTAVDGGDVAVGERGGDVACRGLGLDREVDGGVTARGARSLATAVSVSGRQSPSGPSSATGCRGAEARPRAVDDARAED